MFTDGVLVVGVNDVDSENGSVNPAKTAGIKLGDSILTINGKAMLTNEDVGAVIANSNGKKLTVVLRRKSQDMTVSLQPVKSQSDGKYKAGIWVRDSSAGIGTVTFYDPSTGSFGGLGHAICDVDTGDVLPLMSGRSGRCYDKRSGQGKSRYAGRIERIFCIPTCGWQPID